MPSGNDFNMAPYLSITSLTSTENLVLSSQSKQFHQICSLAIVLLVELWVGVRKCYTCGLSSDHSSTDQQKTILDILHNKNKSRLGIYNTQNTFRWLDIDFLNCQTLKFRLTHSLTQSFTHWFIHSFTYSLTRLLTHSLTHLPTHSLTNSLAHSLTHSLTRSLTHSPTHSLTHSLIRSLTHSFI